MTPLERLLESPPEAVRSVLVDSLEHEQDATYFENGGAHAGGDASTPRGLAGPGAAWVRDGEEDEEAIEDPDDLFSVVSKIGHSFSFAFPFPWPGLISEVFSLTDPIVNITATSYDTSHTGYLVTMRTIPISVAESVFVGF